MMETAPGWGELGAATICIGISSWTDLPGFYPSRIKADDKLAWYARHFGVVEINVSFYRVVAQDTYTRWLDKTPPTLMFDIKAFRELTHERSVSPMATFKGFSASLQPLRTAKRLGAILFQFPPSFSNTLASREYIAGLPDHMPEDHIVVEFRHASWLNAESVTETLALLRDVGISLAVVDEPWLPPHTTPLVTAVTDGTLSYVRLHGRNAQGWFEGRGQRYAYDYSALELEEIARIVRRLASESRQVHVLFNNNATGAGTSNAQQLARMLGVAMVDVPDAVPQQIPLLEFR